MHVHVPEKTLEKYAMGKLREEQKLPVEEHLIVCERCQDAVDLVHMIRATLKATEPKWVQ